MPKQNLGFRVDEAIFVKLEKLVKKTGRSQTELLTEALLKFLGEKVEASPDVRLQELSKRVDAQKNMIDSLYEHFGLTWTPDGDAEG